MESFQSFTLFGTLGKDPDVRAVKSGTKVANFSMVTEEKYTDRDGQPAKNTEWHKVVAWRELADIAATMVKGQQCFVKGKIQTRSWDDQNGQKRYSTEVVAQVILPAPPRDSYKGAADRAASGATPAGRAQDGGNPPYNREDDLPF